MTKAVISGLPLGFSYGCAQGTIVAVEAGCTHVAADVSCTLVCPCYLNNHKSTLSGLGLAQGACSISAWFALDCMSYTDDISSAAI